VVSNAAFRRILELERDAKAPLGVLRGILATDGEASDGHILSIAGGEVAPGIPLLYGHDSYSGARELGSWTAFRKTRGESLGESRIDGEAEIELEGKGVDRDWREDMAVKVKNRRVRGLSIRWDPLIAPTPRVNLSSDHPAYVDAEKERGTAKRWGLYFSKWRALEGSVVPIGADREALIESARGETPLAGLYRSAVLDFDQHAGDLEHEVEARVASLELFLRPGKVPAGAAAPQRRRTARTREQIDALFERLFAEQCSKALGDEFLDELKAKAMKVASRLTGRK